MVDGNNNPGYLPLLKFSLIAASGYLLLTSVLAMLAPPAKAVSTERGKELIYLLRQDCGSCHGMRLKGGLGPALLKSNLVGKPKSFIVQTIREGRPNTAMPPWKSQLSEADIDYLADFLLSDANTEINSDSPILSSDTGAVQ